MQVARLYFQLQSLPVWEHYQHLNALRVSHLQKKHPANTNYNDPDPQFPMFILPNYNEIALTLKGMLRRCLKGFSCPGPGVGEVEEIEYRT